MNGPELTQLKDTYSSHLKQGRWKAYVSDLCEDGLIWLFNQDITPLISHLAPLGSAPKDISPPTRLLLLSECINPSATSERIETLFQTLLEEKDFEGAAAAAGAGVSVIWTAGTDWRAFDPWYQKIARLLDREDILSHLAGAHISGSKALVEYLGLGDLHKAAKTFRTAIQYSEAARSPSMIVFNSAGLGHVFAHMLKPSQIEVILFDIKPLAVLPECSSVAKNHYQILVHLFHLITGDLLKAREPVEKLMKDPSFEMLPAGVWYMIYVQLMMTVCARSERDEINALCEKVAKRAIPEHNHMAHGFAHYSLGIAGLTLGNPEKALLHGREMLGRAKMCHFLIMESFAALLIGQALYDLERIEEARTHWRDWLENWESRHYHVFLGYGALELSHLFLKQGDVERARYYFAKAAMLYPPECNFNFWPRPPDFYRKLKRAFSPDLKAKTDWVNPEDAAVRIETFGKLYVRIGETVLDGGKWRGSTTKMLLAAIIVNGGIQVPLERLSDTLWPDADGDTAMGNLKVTLHRLRQKARKDDGSALSWIEVKNKRVSLVKTLCNVDSINFSETLSEAMKENADTELLGKALDLYKDEFLESDVNESWIVDHRESLKASFTEGVVMFSECYLQKETPENPLPYLLKALDRQPLNEELSAHLMRCYIAQGYPSKAIQVFNRAEQVLRDQLNVSPGPVLRSLAQKARRAG